MTSLIYLNYYKSIDANKTFYIAGFDLDWTIIKTKSGNIFPQNKNDWELLDPKVLTKLQTLSLDPNCLIVIISNQKGIGIPNKLFLSRKAFIEKINDIHKYIKLDFIFIASVSEDIYRKPRIGSINYLIEKENILINIDKSYYVGDMAGRPNDKTDTDIKFAKNLKINFYTPDNFFLNDKSHNNFNLTGYLLDNNSTNTKIHIKPKDNTMIIISGYPSSGKSHLAKKLTTEHEGKSFKLFSRDLFENKFHKKLITSMESGKPVIVEGLYPTNQSRYELKNLSDKYKYDTVYIHVKTSYELAYHLNLYRSLFDNIKKVPEIVYMKYRKTFEYPEYSDWDEIIEYHPHISSKINKYYLF